MRYLRKFGLIGHQLGRLNGNREIADIRVRFVDERVKHLDSLPDACMGAYQYRERKSVSTELTHSRPNVLAEVGARLNVILHGLFFYNGVSDSRM